jgi:hypothetical protein
MARWSLDSPCPPVFLLRGYPGGAKLVSGRHFAEDRLRYDME